MLIDAQMRAPEERTVDFGAHQACCPLLQALFMRQSDHDQDRHGEDDQNGGFYRDLATAGPKPAGRRIFVVQK